MAGLRDLDQILQQLTVSRRPGSWTMVSIPASEAEPEPLIGQKFAAIIVESEGTTVVTTVDDAGRRGWPVDFRAAWLTLEVHSALDGIGLTAVVSRGLAEVSIPANMLAGFFHDHLLVPEDRAEEAMTVISQLADKPGI